MPTHIIDATTSWNTQIPRSSRKCQPTSSMPLQASKHINTTKQQIVPTNIVDATTSWHTHQHHVTAASANQHHRCHYKLTHTPTPRNITINPQSIYTGLLNTIPPHTILATRRPPRLEIHHSDLTVTRQDRVYLSSFRCWHHLT